MSHTTDTSAGTVFIHNGDYSGSVTVHRPGQPEIKVPFADLREFVFGYLRAKMIAGLEDASLDELERVLTGSLDLTEGQS